MHKQLAAAFALATLTLTAQAAPQSYYAGASVGASHWDADCAGTSSCKNDDTTFRIQGGYDFAPNIGVEVGYFDLGKVTARVGGLSAGMKANGTEVAAMFRTGANGPWGFFAKLGVTYVRSEVEARVGGFSGTDTKNSVGGVGGIGATYQINGQLRARMDLDSRRVKVADGDGGTGSVVGVTIGMEAVF